jgi:hypothetical protein
VAQNKKRGRVELGLVRFSDGECKSSFSLVIFLFLFCIFIWDRFRVAYSSPLNGLNVGVPEGRLDLPLKTLGYARLSFFLCVCVLKNCWKLSGLRILNVILHLNMSGRLMGFLDWTEWTFRLLKFHASLHVLYTS